MNKRILRFGFLIGLVGGGAMALFAMAATWATGRGFFTVVNLFAHTFWRDAPMDGTFSLAALGLGLLIHLVMSTMVGTTIAWLVDRGQLDAGIVILFGVGIGSAVWVVQAFAWTAIDADAHQQFTPWILATAHLVFALGAATFLTWLQRRDDIGIGIGLATAVDTDTDDDPDAAVVPGVVTEPLAMADHLTAPRATRSGFSRTVPVPSESAQKLP